MSELMTVSAGGGNNTPNGNRTPTISKGFYLLFF